MPDAGNSLSCFDFRASSDLSLALDLSITSKKRSMINLQGESLAVKWIRSARDNTISDGVDWSAFREVKIAARMQAGAARPRGCKRSRSFFPALGWNSRKRKQPLRNVRNIFRRLRDFRRDSE